MDEHEIRKLSKEEASLLMTTELGKYHMKVNAMIDCAYESKLNPILYIRLMQRMSEDWINKEKEEAKTDDEKEVIEGCIKLIDGARDAKVFGFKKKEKEVKNE